MKRTVLIAATLIAMTGAAHAAPTRRFALLIAHNEGGADTVKLRYAETDANKLAGILGELGGYREGDIVRVLGDSADRVLGALDEIEARVRAAKTGESAHTTLLVYYSGHGKDGVLRLGASKLPMQILRTKLLESAADMKLGILDACESGAITREKGGRRGPSFLFDTDDREANRGLILISSSSADEASQESDELGGSFFTHYLTSGLRGDADESGDRRVTLGEVYRYTYNKTVAITANTRAGTQHPTYSYDLQGNGDIVLTDLTQGASGIFFPDVLAGDFMIFDVERDSVAAEVKKVAGTPRRIALSPGEYVVKKRLGDHLRMRRFTLGAASFYEVDETTMDRVDFEDDYAKGSALIAAETRERSMSGSLRLMIANQMFFSSAAREELFPQTMLYGVAMDVGPVLGGRFTTELLLGGRSEQVLKLSSLSIGYDFFEAQLSTSLMWGADAGMFSFQAGPRLALMYLKRSFPNDPMLRAHAQDFGSLSPGAAGGISFYPGRDRDFSIELVGRLGVLLFGVDDNRALVFEELGLTLGYRL